MKNRFKKITALISALAIMVGAIACVSGLYAAADDVYITKTLTYNCTTDGIDGSISGNKYLRYSYGNTSVIEAGTYGFIPLSYSAGNACYEVWEQENISEFSLYTMNSKTISDSEMAKWYIFAGSADGSNWYSLTAHRDSDYSVLLGTSKSFASYKLTVSDIPTGTRYIRLTAIYDNSHAWNHGFLSVEIRYTERLEAPEIQATYKNYYGVYANPLTDGGKAIRATKLTISNMGAFTGGTVSVMQNGTAISAADLYDEKDDCYLFTSDGSYTVTAENSAGNSSLHFTLKMTNEDTVVTKTTIDDIYNNGKSMAIERTDLVDSTSRVSMGITKSNNASLLPVGKAYMFPYNSGRDEPAAYAVWYNEIGFGSFWIDTFNSSKVKTSYFEEYYSFYYSADGASWTQTSFVIGDKITGLTGSSTASYRLIVDKIPDGAKYIKFLSLITDATKNSGWQSGLIRAGYTSYVLKPEINAYYVDSLGSFVNPVVDGVTVPSSVQVNFVDIEEQVEGTYSIYKNGEKISLPEDGILSGDASYQITASNVKGTATLNFTISSALATAKSETYVFSEGVKSAQSDYDRLLSITPPGASSDFTKGDGHVIVNDTGIQRYSDNLPWWGLTEGGTKLAIGSDSKGYQKDGYFYFVNKGNDGKAYTGISITYTAPIQSSYPTDGYLAVYTADKYNGKYRLVKPINVIKDSYTGAPAAAVFHATYYLGGEGTVVKIEFHPQAPVAELWKGGFLSILNLTKLSLPLIEATDGKTKLVYNSVTKQNVNLSITNALYSFITKDGVRIDMPKDHILTEDGYYTVTACNYSGTSTVSFYLAKAIPVIQLEDLSGNYLSDGETVTDNVKAIFYNADTAITSLNGEEYSTKSTVVLDLNGVYTFTAENSLGTFECKLIFDRPLPTVNAYNFQSHGIKEGETVVTQVTYSIATADSYTITRNNKSYVPKTEFLLTEEGEYAIQAVNKAGKTTLHFIIKYNPPLPKLAHEGDTVVTLDYETMKRSSIVSDFVYSYDSLTLDTSKALQSNWTGFTGGILHTTVTGDTQSMITYKTVGFKSFHLYVGVYPQKGIDVTDIYILEASVNGKDFTKLDYTVEHDISYITTGYQKYRLVAKNIPDGAKYLRVLIDQNGTNTAWYRCITKAEFSYNKANVGKLDVDDILFMISDVYDGDTVEVKVNNGDVVIPKKVFAALKDNDITLKINLLDKKGEPTYFLSFNGLDVVEPMDFHVGVSEGSSKGSAILKKLETNTFAILLKQTGEWTLKATLGVALGNRQNGISYALYQYENGEFTLVSTSVADSNGFLRFDLQQYGDYIISSNTKLIKEEESESIEPVETIDEDQEIAPTYFKVVNRKKYITNNAVKNNHIFLIVLICVAAGILIAAILIFIVLLKNGKIKIRKG